MTNGIKHVLTAQIRALASTSYAIFRASQTSETGMIFFNFVSKFSKVYPGDHIEKWAKVQTFFMFWGILFNCLKFIDYLFNCLEFIHLLC